MNAAAIVTRCKYAKLCHKDVVKEAKIESQRLRSQSKFAKILHRSTNSLLLLLKVCNYILSVFVAGSSKGLAVGSNDNNTDVRGRRNNQHHNLNVSHRLIFH